MKQLQIGKKLLRRLRPAIVAVCMAGVLSGCGESKYQAVDLAAMESSAAVESVLGESAVRSISFENNGEDGGSVEKTPDSGEKGEVSPGVSDGETSAAEAISGTAEESLYIPVDEMVTVTADVLNVRREARENARIYVQLKTGDTLRRTGYSDTWSQVEYDGQTAYVASDMVEALEETPEVPLSDGAAVFAAALAAEEEGGPSDAENGNFNGHIVAIDPGHQAKANAEKEAIGPGSATMKAKMPEAARGVATGVNEYEMTLSVAQKLEKELELRGYKVVMTRESNDVNISCAERARLANESGADIFIRLHGNSMDNSSVYGALTMCMTEGNPYNSHLYSQSYALSKQIVDQICVQTGTKNRGVQEVDNSGELNWSEIPVSVVELGFLTNPDEDRWLQDNDYQAKIVAGIAAAVDSYFANEY